MTTSVDITGLRKAVTKQLDLTLDQYNGLAKEGDLIIDCNPGPTLNQLFVGTANGSLVPVSNGGGGNSNYSNANVANYLPIYTGNISGDYIILTHDVTANVVDANYLYGEGSNVTNVAALTANTVIDSAQPNITSVGTLTSLTVAGAVLPAANVTHDLGSPTQRWNSIYLSNNTIYLGNSALSVDSGGNLTVDGDAVATVNSSGNLVVVGNIQADNVGTVAAINLDGNVANVLAGDGTWIAAGGGGGNANTGNFVFANSTMSTPYPDIMLIQTLDASGANLRTQLRFDPDLSQASMSARSSTFNESYTSSSWTTAEYTGTQIDFVDAPDLVQFLSSSSFDNGVNKQFSINGGNMTAYTSASYSASNVTIYTSVPASPDPTTVTTIEFSWQLESEFEIDYDDPSMNITARGMSIYIRNDGTQTPDINIYSGDDITLRGRDKLSGTTSEGGDINVYAGRGSADDGLGNPSGGGGDIQIFAGDGGSGNSGFGAQGGFARLRGGAGGSAGVSASAGIGGSIEIEAGNGGDNNGNSDLGSLGGYVSITAGSTTLANIQGGNVSIQSGEGGANSLAGNVSIITPAGDIGVGGTWVFDGDGLLTLPGGSSKIGSILGTDAILANNQSFGVATQGNSVTTFLNWSDDIANTSMLSAIYVNAPMGNVGDIYLRTGDVASPNVWQFGSDGTTLIPGNIDVNNQHIINVATITADVVLIPANTMTTDTLDLATGNLFVRTITGATTLSLLNIPTAGNNTAFTLQLTDAGSNITWWSGIKWANGTPPTLTVSGTDVLSFYSYDGGTSWVGIVLAQNIS